MDTQEKIYKIKDVTEYIQAYVEEREAISNELKSGDSTNNPFWFYRGVEDVKMRLQQIERVLRYLLNKQAELMQSVQQQTIKNVM